MSDRCQIEKIDIPVPLLRQLPVRLAQFLILHFQLDLVDL